jgi:hypothetical protein
LEEGQWRYAFDNSGLAKVDSIFDPHRPYQSNRLTIQAFIQVHSPCTSARGAGNDFSILLSFPGVRAPNREHHIANRELGTFERIEDSGNLQVRLDSGRTVAFNIKENPHLDYGYTVTSHNSHRQTADRVLVHVDTEQEKSSSTVDWLMWPCRGDAMTRNSTPTTNV